MLTKESRRGAFLDGNFSLGKFDNVNVIGGGGALDRSDSLTKLKEGRKGRGQVSYKGLSDSHRVIFSKPELLRSSFERAEPG